MLKTNIVQNMLKFLYKIMSLFQFQMSTAYTMLCFFGLCRLNCEKDLNKTKI